jgi:hypothetical protein
LHVPLQALSVLLAQSILLQQLLAGMQPVPHAMKPVAHVEQRPAPEHEKPAGQLTAFGKTQVPALQVPVPWLWPFTHMAVPQELLVYEQVCVVRLHVPGQSVAAWGQSPSMQQLPVGMQAPLHSLKPLAQTALHKPAPEQVKLPVHVVVAPGAHVPPEQLPAATRLPSAQLAVLQLAVVG